MTTEPTEKHREEAREVVRRWADAIPMVSWFDLDELVIRNLPHELYATELINAIAERAASRDAETREVLGGLSRVLRFRNGLPQRCWCEDPNSNWTHTPACVAARALYNRLQSAKES